ncbi:MAG: ABC transporter permease [Candidatus Bipolaricaulis sp.]|nr:ABC transporter permease [Candidatus Bipolaricaulis sp.]
MRLRSVIRWEFLRTIQSKQFLIMSLLIPAVVAVAIFAATAADKGAQQSLREPPPPFVVALILATILFMGAFLSGVMALYSVVKEKQGRVVELVLSSISAQEMMAGKVIGLGMAGLIQVAVWAAAAYFIAGRFTPISLAGLGPVHWITYPLYFVLGFMLIASIYAATGAVMKDVQSGGATGLVGLVPYIPIMFSAFIIENPNHLLVRIAGFVPPFAPSVMLLRVGAGAAPAWEIGLSLASLALGVFLTMRFAARVFEIGLLMYGKSPSLRELWRWGRAGRAR